MAAHAAPDASAGPAPDESAGPAPDASTGPALAPADDRADRGAAPFLRVFGKNGPTALDLQPSELGGLLAADAGAVAVLCVPRGEVRALWAHAGHLTLDELAIEDVEGAREQPKLDRVGATVVLVTATVTLDREAGRVSSTPLSVLVTPRLLVVVADLDDGLASLLASLGGTIAESGVGGALHAILDHVVDGYTDTLLTLEDDIDGLIEQLFDDRSLDRDQYEKAFRLRRSLTRLRRIISPMRNVADELAAAAGRPDGEQNDDDIVSALLPARTERRFADVASHVAHVADAADGLRDVMSSLYETSLSLADVHLNTVMRKLTAYAALIAVPTLVTGFMGMNVPYPGFGTWGGFLGALGVMIVAIATLVWLFRRSGWI